MNSRCACLATGVSGDKPRELMEDSCIRDGISSSSLKSCPECGRIWMREPGKYDTFTVLVSPVLARVLREAAARDEKKSGVPGATNELAWLLEIIRSHRRKGDSAAGKMHGPDREESLDGALFPFSQQAWKRAMDIAAQAHEEQKTPGGRPYLAHLSSVSMEVMAAINPDGWGYQEANLALECALLHDVLEDTGLRSDDLRAQGISQEVVLGVQALTKDSDLPCEEQLPDSLKRLRAQPRTVQSVKLADRITNLDPPPAHWDREKIMHYADETLVIYFYLHAASPSLSRRLLSRLANYQVQHLSG